MWVPGEMRDKLTDENQRRIEILVGFGKLQGNSVSGNRLLNMAVENYFMEIYNKYRQSANPKDFVLEMMQQVLPEDTELDGRIHHARKNI